MYRMALGAGRVTTFIVRLASKQWALAMGSVALETVSVVARELTSCSWGT